MSVICKKFILQLKRGLGFCMSRYALLAPFHWFVDALDQDWDEIVPPP